MTQTSCYLRVPGCTASYDEHPKADPTMYSGCLVHSERPGRDGGRRGPVIQHYDRKTGRYVCWHCATDAFHDERTCQLDMSGHSR